MTATFQNMLPIGSTSFDITTEPYAYVGLSKEGVLHGAALADENGLVTLEIIPFATPGEADVVISGQNRAPFIGTLTVASPNGPYVLFDEFTINDAAANNNGQADFGENILLNVSLENVGNDDANNVSATISTTDTMVSITDDLGEWGQILANDSLLLTMLLALKFTKTSPISILLCSTW